MTKPKIVAMRPAKTQISLGIRSVWSESSLCAQQVAKGPMFLHAAKILILSLIRASSRENLSSGFPTRYDSNRPAQLQKLARVFTFWI